MSIISWLILGLIAGFIGSKIVNSTGQGIWLDIARALWVPSSGEFCSARSACKA